MNISFQSFSAYVYMIRITLNIILGLPWWLSGKESACSAGDAGLIPGLGRSPGEGNGNPVQYSYLENPTNREVWQVIVHGVIKELDTI